MGAAPAPRLKAIPQLDTEEVQGLGKVLFSRPDRIGDVVITSACLSPIRQSLPHCRISLLVRRALTPLFVDHPLIEAVIPIPEFPESARTDGAALTGVFQQRKFDCIVHLNGDHGVHAASKRAGIRYRVGYPAGFGTSTLTHAIADRRSEGRKHEALYSLDLLRFLRVEIPELLRPSLSPDRSGERRVEKNLPIVAGDRSFAVFHATAHGNKARLPAGVLARIALWLSEERHCDIVIVGSEIENPSVALFKRELPDTVRSWDLTGRTSLDELAWLLGRATVFIGRDSGPAHIAAAMGCPTVAIMGPHKKRSTAARWAPLGDRVRIVEGVAKPGSFETDRAFQRRYFSSIESKEIIEKISDLV